MSRRDRVLPFVGREEELARVAGLVGAPSGGGVVIAGPAGVGKSRLAAEAVRRAGGDEGQQLVVSRAAGSASMSAVPFGALTYLMAEFLADGEAPAERSPLAVVRRLSDGLRAAAGDRRAVLVLDDAHQLDHPSLEVVRQLVANDRLVLVATVRDDDTLPEPLAAMCRSGQLARLDLGPLGAAAEELLIATALGGPVDRLTLEAVHEVAKGNPLLLVNLLRDGLDAGVLAVREGMWNWRGRIGAGTHLGGIIRARLAGLPPAQREAVELLALGSPLPVSVLAALVGEDIVDDLGVRGLVELAGWGEAVVVEVAHPLYGDLARDLIPLLRRRRLYARLIAGFRARVPESPASVLRIALWSLEGGVPAPADLLATGARLANDAHDYPTARRLARAALDRGGGLRAGLELAYAQRFAGDASGAVATLARLVGSDPHEVDGPVVAGPVLGGPVLGGPVLDRATPDELFDLAMVWSQTLVYGLDRSDAACRVLDDLAARLEPVRALRLAREKVVQSLWSGRGFECIAEAEALLGSADLPVETRLRLAGPTAVYLAGAGRATEALALVDRHLALAIDQPDAFRWAAEELVSVRYVAQTLHGTLTVVDLEGLAEEADRRGSRLLVDPTQALVALGRVALLRGRANEAAGLLRGAAASLRESDPSGFLAITLAMLAHAAALTGDADAAHANRSEVAGTEVRRGVSRAGEPEVRWFLAWSTLAAGGTAAVAAHLVEVQGWCAERGYRTVELWAAHDLVRLGHLDQRARVRALAPAVDGRWSAALAAHVDALDADDDRALLAAARQLAGIGLGLQAAEAATDAAEAAGRHDDPAGVRAARAARTRVLSAGDGTRPPGGWHLDLPVPLTRRERQIADLAARRLSNPEIAGRLGVSVRTVESHLTRLYAKLGVSDRTSLAGLLGIAQPPPRR